MKQSSVVHSDPDILGGTPVFIGTRVPVQALIDYIEGGHSRAGENALARRCACCLTSASPELYAWSFLATKSRRLLKPGGPASRMARLTYETTRHWKWY